MHLHPMSHFCLTVFLLLSMAPLIAILASPLPSLDEEAPTLRVVEMPVFRRESEQLSERGTVSTDIVNWPQALPYYTVMVSAGTPPQTMELVVDTGSGQTWFYGLNSCPYNDSAHNYTNCGGTCKLALVASTDFHQTHPIC